MVEAPAWFPGPIWQASIYLMEMMFFASIVSEIISRLFDRRSVDLFLLVVSVPASFVPSAYVLACAFLGAEVAEMNSWHLRPFFMLMYQVLTVAAVSTVYGMGWGLFALIKISMIDEAPHSARGDSAV